MPFTNNHGDVQPYISHLADRIWIPYIDEKLTDTTIEHYKRIVFESIDWLSTVDSRHAPITHTLRDYFSEYALHKYRIKVEIAHLIQMSEHDFFPEVKSLTIDQKFKLYKLIEDFTKKEAQKILSIDHFWYRANSWDIIWPTEHDVKSVEYYLQEKFDELWLSHYKSFIHFLATSEDINNIAYSSMLRDGINHVMMPKLRWILSRFSELADKHKDLAILGRTHWQAASPTTFGKEISVFIGRILKQLKRLDTLKLDVKFNWSVWNYNAHILSKPDVDWIAYTENLANKFWFEADFLTGQRWPMTEIVTLFQIMQAINFVLIDFCEDMWLYNSVDNWLVFHCKIASEVWSSVMPQKVNPWFLEEAKWCLVQSNDMMDTVIRNSDISKFQRDMTWHPHERNYGDILWNTLIAYTNILESLKRIDVNQKVAQKQLKDHAEIVTEWVQSILRREWVVWSYELLKQFARWNKLTIQNISTFVMLLWLDDELVDLLYPLNSKWLEWWIQTHQDRCKYLSELFADETLDQNSRQTVPENWFYQASFYKRFSTQLSSIIKKNNDPSYIEKIKKVKLSDVVLKELKGLSPFNYYWLAPQLAKKWVRDLSEFMKLFDNKITLTTKRRLHAILTDFDWTLQLGDKEELKQRIMQINSNLWMWLLNHEIFEIWNSTSDWREMVRKIVDKANSKPERRQDFTEEIVIKENKKVSWNFDDKFWLDEWVKETLKFATNQKIKLGVVTTRWSNSSLRLLWEFHNIKHMFDIIITRDDVTHRKPNPEGIEKALKAMWINLDTSKIVIYIWDKFNEDVKVAWNSWVIPWYIERVEEEWVNNCEKSGVLSFKNMKELFIYLYEQQL